MKKGIKYSDESQDADFLKIGKTLPYKEPDGYFVGLPVRTLEAAKKRKTVRIQHQLIWRSVAVAASVAAVAWLFFLNQEREMKSTIVENNTEKIETPGVQKQNQPTFEIQTPEKSKQELMQKPVNESFALPENEENVSEVLERISDEELMELAAMFEADLFTEERNLDN